MASVSTSLMSPHESLSPSDMAMQCYALTTTIPAVIFCNFYLAGVQPVSDAAAQDVNNAVPKVVAKKLFLDLIHGLDPPRSASGRVTSKKQVFSSFYFAAQVAKRVDM